MSGEVICSRNVVVSYYYMALDAASTSLRRRGFDPVRHMDGCWVFAHATAFEVDGIVYPARSPAYQGPMYSLKIENPAMLSSKAHAANDPDFKLHKLNKEWRDLEWDPTIRL